MSHVRPNNHYVIGTDQVGAVVPASLFASEQMIRLSTVGARHTLQPLGATNANSGVLHSLKTQSRLRHLCLPVCDRAALTALSSCLVVREFAYMVNLSPAKCQVRWL